MRHRVVVLLLGCLPVAAGCLATDVERPATWSKRLRWPGSAPANGLVQMDVALIERPIGDPYLNQELWTATDEQVVSLEQRAVLDDNGFRIGQVVGMTPGRFQALLTSERSCINPRRRLVQPGTAAAVVLGPVQEQCDFTVRHGELNEEIALQKAEFLLEVTPVPTGEGKTRLVFRPAVQHGEALADFKAAAAGWTLQLDRPIKRFPGMEWEVTLGANEYLVIGALFHRRGTLGFQAFVQTEQPPLQRVLVLRTGPPAEGPAEPADRCELADLLRNNPSPPLALQASKTAIRASRR